MRFLATTLVASVSMPVMPSQAVAAELATDLIISEYIEGLSNNKAIELYNGTGSTIDLSQYKLELYTNGSTTPTALKVSQQTRCMVGSLDKEWTNPNSSAVERP
ncbi:hypothetical protein LSPH24S_04475 [Lysinibacillus sphaericus]